MPLHHKNNVDNMQEMSFDEEIHAEIIPNLPAAG